MGFNTIYCDLICPFCKEKVPSGVGFKLGAIKNATYKIGDRLSWEGPLVRPAQRPVADRIVTVGYFNCDNIRCSSWQDCYPMVQKALITVENDVISKIELYDDTSPSQDFEIIEPPGLL